MATFVLVHGAWSGANVWDALTLLLRNAGHTVFTPTLTGLGERRHLASPDTDLDTHIRDIVSVLQAENLRGVILVGASYGGMPISGASDQEWQRISHLVFVDAFVPKDGDCGLDFGGPLTRLSTNLPEGEWRIPPPVSEIKEGDQVVALEPHPLASVKQQIRLSTPIESRPFGRTFVLATNPARAEFVQIAERIRGNPAWSYLELPTGHMVMISMPRQLASLLESLVAER